MRTTLWWSEPMQSHFRASTGGHMATHMSPVGPRHLAPKSTTWDEGTTNLKGSEDEQAASEGRYDEPGRDGLPRGFDPEGREPARPQRDQRSSCREGRQGCRHYLISEVDIARALACLLYTSDAADDLLCVDLGG